MAGFTVTFDALPPSLNNSYRNAGRKRVKTEPATQWATYATGKIKTTVPTGERIGGVIRVVLRLPSDMRGDLDNRIKPVLDALVTSGRIDDDKNVMEIRAIRDRGDDKCSVTVKAWCSAAPALANGRA